MKNWCVIVFLYVYVYCVSCDDITVDLSIYHPREEKYFMFKKYYNIITKKVKINVININNDVGFFVIQTHTYMENVTLSDTTIPKFAVSGTNLGLVWTSDELKTSASFSLTRNIVGVNTDLNVLLVVALYDKNDPVPGGCNLSFDPPVAPYQLTEYNDDVIMVKSQPPSYPGARCDDTEEVQVHMYHIYLPEYDNTVTSYFNYLEKMLTVKDILKHGKKVPNIKGARKYKRMYSNYRGTGEVFAVVSSYKNGASAYVPTISYGCDYFNWDEKCLGPVAVHWKFFCACLLIFGTFICFFGHRFFRITLYIISFLFGLSITYLAISVEEHFSFTELTITAFTVGFVYGLIWLFIWRRFGIPVLTVNLAFLLSGFLAASLLFNTVLADVSVFINPINFWFAFLSAILICVVISLPMMLYGHICSISFLGAYGFITALSFYIGGNLPYIIINTYRRVAVKDFNMAVIDPPFQTIDIIHVVLWVLLFLSGALIQLRHQRGKPPFPPNRTGMVLRNEHLYHHHDQTEETTPLIYRDIFAPPPMYSQ